MFLGERLKRPGSPQQGWIPQVKFKGGRHSSLQQELVGNLYVYWWIQVQLVTTLMLKSAQRGMKIEAEDKPEELKMADGTMVKIEGRVQLKLKCGGYRGDISTSVFPNMNKQMILGTPWLSK